MLLPAGICLMISNAIRMIEIVCDFPVYVPLDDLRGFKVFVMTKG